MMLSIFKTTTDELELAGGLSRLILVLDYRKDSLTR